MTRASFASLLALPLTGLVALTGCTASTPEPAVDETYVSDPSEPSAEPSAPITPNPIEPDTTVIVRATATASTGAQLDLELQVHRSVRWDDVASQTLPAALLEDCATLYTGALFADEQWSFTRVNVTAIPSAGSTGEWPETAQILARPSAEFVPVAGRGDFLSVGSASTPLCQRDKYLASPGKAALAFGLPGDGGDLIAWAQHQYGISLVGATLTACTVEVTALGQSAGAGGSGWTTVSDDENCLAGAVEETSVF
jgi:hypothetical protein